jgi:hypothetical protein
MRKPFFTMLVLTGVLVSAASAQQPRSGGLPPVPAPIRLQAPPVQQKQAEPTNRSAFKIARLKYSGGGDWYNDPSSEINLLRYVRANTNISVEPVYEFVDLASDNIFLYPMLFMTGHGTVNLSTAEARRLRSYLDNGGFLYIDDDYGMDASIRE